MLPAGPLCWEMAVPDFLETFETWLPLEKFDNAKWIRRQLVEMMWKKWASEGQEARKKRRGGNKRPATDLGKHVATKLSGNVAELPNTTFMVVIR